MKNVLVIGSTVTDVVIRLSHVPRTGEDINIWSQSMSLGGCAHNVSDTIRHFKIPYILFSPIGTGVYGGFVREELAKKGVFSPIPTPDRDNGCCYCFVEDSGERTFVCHRGAEYHFRPEWFSVLEAEAIDSVYLCGLEMEEADNCHIIDFLHLHPEYTVYFAPGPRIHVIPEERLEKLFALSPILHLNDTEALSYTKTGDVPSAARALWERTKNTVIVTLGGAGAYYETGNESGTVPGFPARQIDTIGAGDSHIGAIISCLKQGDSIQNALRRANRVSAAVVETEGALLPDEVFDSLSI